MSRRIPVRSGPERSPNIVLLLREAFVALNDLVIVRLAERGHDAVRPAHAAVFQYLDDTGTTVSVLAQRARMTKQGMAQLVHHLEDHGYIARTADPGDRRAKLVIPTDRGLEVFAIAQEIVPEIEDLVSSIIGADHKATMRDDLAAIRHRLRTSGDAR